MAAHPVKLTDGTTVDVDANYLRESILNPQAKVVRGFQPVMPTFRGSLNDRQIDALIAYMQSLQ
jgi:cytochrome c oxidase subunit 2